MKSWTTTRCKDCGYISDHPLYGGEVTACCSKCRGNDLIDLCKHLTQKETQIFSEYFMTSYKIDREYSKRHKYGSIYDDRNTSIGDHIVLSSDKRSLNMFKDEAYEFASDMVVENETPKVEIYKLVAIVEVEKSRIKITEV